MTILRLQQVIHCPPWCMYWDFLVEIWHKVDPATMTQKYKLPNLQGQEYIQMRRKLSTLFRKYFGFLSGLRLCRTCSCYPSCYEPLWTTVLLGLRNTVPVQSSGTTGSSSLLALYSSVVSEPWDRECDQCPI